MDEVVSEFGIDKLKIKLRLGFFGVEVLIVEMRREIEKKWGFFVIENYGFLEIIGLGVFGECEYREGLYINEDYFYFEIIKFDIGEVFEEGEIGEFVLIIIIKEGMFFIRYRIRDIILFIYEFCKCGRINVRMIFVKGRIDDMLIIWGVNVFFF